MFNSTVWGFWEKYFADDAAVRDALYSISDKRGDEDPEMTAEIKGLSDASGLPFKFVKSIQMLYELQTLMVPVVNVTKQQAEVAATLPEEYKALARIPWRGPGCTGIIATDVTTGVVSHARNLDFSPVPFMTHLVFTGIFRKGGVEVFRSQMVAGYVQVITAYKAGPNGFAIERNTRYPDHPSGNELMFHNLESGRPLNGWTLRKICETQPDYEAAVNAIATTPYVSTEYAIVSGVRKGTILAKDPDSVAHTQVLGEANFDERSDYIIMTNFDFYFHDFREFFDPTGGQIGYPRRVEAQKLLNASAVLTPEVLFNTINHKGVLADTIFQAVISVETGLWNVSQPDL